VAIGTVALATAAFAGGAYAATQNPGTNARQAFLNDAAKQLHVTPAQLDSALKKAALDRLSAAVKAGKLTQAEADAIKRQIQNDNASPFFFRFGLHPPGLHPPVLHPRIGHFGEHRALAPAAKYLGLTDAQLRQQLSSGKSLAQIAKAQGKSTSGLEQALTSAIKARLDRAVANKRITAAQEQKLLSRLSGRIGDLINRTPPKLGKGVHPGVGPRAFGYHHFGGRFARPYGAPPPGGPAGLPAAPPPPGPIA
jgi:hypothetical protein